MKVRPFQPDDGDAIMRIFAQSVRAIPPGDYSTAQLEAWAAGFTLPVRWLTPDPGRMVLVAEEDGEPAGFATFEPDGHIDHLYVHPRFQRQGAASALLLEIESAAAGLGMTRLFTEASATARPFFQNAGFRLLAPQTVSKNGAGFVNYRMEKLLRRGSSE